MSISTRNMASAPYTRVKGVSLVVKWGAVWYNHNTSCSFPTHSLSLSNFFLIPFNITLFVDLACSIASGWTMKINFVCTFYGVGYKPNKSFSNICNAVKKLNRPTFKWNLCNKLTHFWVISDRVDKSRLQRLNLRNTKPDNTPIRKKKNFMTKIRYD